MSNFTNSPLVVYTKISPNKTSPRNHAIDTVTIHVMAGNLTIESCASLFAPTSRQASSNYGIGSDGRIGMYVEEKDRSWCTSSGANDNRAITIEVANSEAKHPWPVSEAAYAALLDLVTDICRRNNIKKILWKADKNLIGQVALQNMTAHRWFAAKACPGDYLYERYYALADAINKRLGESSAPAPIVTPPAATTPPVDVPAAIWSYLTGKGLNAYAVAGIMGNLYAESGLKANNLQNSYEKKICHTDESYTAAVDCGTYQGFVRDCAGYGLAQWTYWSRKQALLNHARAEKASIGSLTMQLNFLWKELQSYTAVMKVLKAAKTVSEASNVILLQYEKPADQSVAAQQRRAGYGQGYYDKFAGKAPVAPPPAVPAPFTPYLVKISASTLNVRAQPTTDSKVVTTIKNGGVYTIVEESTGTGAKKWGKLKSGAGWISLDYVQRV